MTEIIDEKHLITSVSQFLKVKNSYLYTSNINSGKWLYRGESNYEYKLIPSIGRLFGHLPFNEKNNLFDFEKSAFNEFKISTYSQLRETNSFILLAVAQHHGLKTRLLDWSFSPLAALFFAVENEAKHTTDGSLVAFQSQFTFNNFPEGTNSPFANNLNDYHYIFSPDMSPRIKAQQGVFQLFKDPTSEFKEGYNLLKFKIPFKYKKSIKKELESLGVSYKSLFPDLDGLCKTINYNKLKNAD